MNIYCVACWEQRDSFCLAEGRACAVVFDCKFIETSASLHHNVHELFEGIVRQIRLRRDSKETNERRRSFYKRKESITKKARRFLDRLVARNNKKMALKVRSKSCHDLTVLWGLRSSPLFILFFSSSSLHPLLFIPVLRENRQSWTNVCLCYLLFIFFKKLGLCTTFVRILLIILSADRRIVYRVEEDSFWVFLKPKIFFFYCISLCFRQISISVCLIVLGRHLG